MAKESCITHPRNLPFIIIKQGYVNLFSGDHSLAVLMHCFEHFTNIEMERLANAGQEVPEEVWFEATGPAIIHQITGLYSERTVKTCVLCLRQLGLLQVDRLRIGMPNRYFLMVERVNELLERKFKFSFEEIYRGKIAPDENDPTGATTEAAIAPVQGQNLHAIHYVKNKKKEEEIPPTPSFEETPRTDTRASVEFFLRRWGTIRGVKRLSASEREKARERWASVEIAEEDLDVAIGAFEGWFRKVATTLRIRNPLAVFLKDPASWVRPLVLEDSTPPSPPVDLSAPTVEARNFPAEWNAVVKAAPVDWRVGLSPTKQLAACIVNPAFGEHFTEVCEIAQKIHESRGDEANWLTFEWIIKENPRKGYGWWQVRTALKGMAKKAVERSRAQTGDSVNEGLMKKLRARMAEGGLA